MLSHSKKLCNDCKIEKPLSDFYLRSDTGKPRGKCKCCLIRETSTYLRERPELVKESRRKYYYKDLDSSREYHRNWYHQSDKQAATNRKLQWYANNRETVNAAVAKRRAEKLLATPKWLTELHLEDIRTEYALARWCTVVTGNVYHVDHIVPLKGRTVCGLHVPWNLQVIPAAVNLSKSNKLL